MRRQKKSSKQDATLQAVILLTAILNLVRAVIDLMEKLNE